MTSPAAARAKKRRHYRAATKELQAEIARLAERNQKLEAELQEWLCAKDLERRLNDLRTAAERYCELLGGADTCAAANTASLRAAIEASR